mgnify:FL=1
MFSIFLSNYFECDNGSRLAFHEIFTHSLANFFVKYHKTENFTRKKNVDFSVKSKCDKTKQSETSINLTSFLLKAFCPISIYANDQSCTTCISYTESKYKHQRLVFFRHHHPNGHLAFIFIYNLTFS